MKTKVFKTIDEQINILQERGLTIDDIDFAKEELIRENYFFINGYRHLFLESGSDKYYKEGTNFREIIALFNFDRQIRNIFFKNLLVVENNMKSIFSYQLSKEYIIQQQQYEHDELHQMECENENDLTNTNLLNKTNTSININNNNQQLVSNGIYKEDINQSEKQIRIPNANKSPQIKKESKITEKKSLHFMVERLERAIKCERFTNGPRNEQIMSLIAMVDEIDC